MGFDFNYNPAFGKMRDVYIAEFGSETPETTGGKLIPPRVGHPYGFYPYPTIKNTKHENA